MWKWRTVGVAIAGAVLPASSPGAPPCVRGLMPSLNASVGWTSGDWPAGEAIRFVAVPSSRAYMVQIDRASPRGGANVRLVALLEGPCKRWDREQEWRFPLSAEDAALFFDRLATIESHWRPVDESNVIVVGGTRFDYEHRTDGAVRRLQLSAMAEGQSARLSGLILSLMRIARGQIPESPSWSD